MSRPTAGEPAAPADEKSAGAAASAARRAEARAPAATLPVTLVMLQAIRDYYHATGRRVGMKPAGGIAKAKDALLYLALMKDELGHPWLQPDLFRFGASSLLGDIERQLEHHLTGHYSAANRHAMG